MRDALQTYAPQGLVQQLQAGWHGPLAQPRQYQLRAKVSGLAIAAQARNPAVVGLTGADVELDLTQQGDARSWPWQTDGCCCPVKFEDPVLPVQQLSATLRWQVEGQRIAVQTNDLRFGNADAQARRAWPGARRMPPHHRHARAFRACWSSRPPVARRRHARAPLPAAGHPGRDAPLRARRHPDGQCPRGAVPRQGRSARLSLRRCAAPGRISHRRARHGCDLRLRAAPACWRSATGPGRC